MAFAFIGEAVASGIIGKLAEAAYAAVEEKLLPAGDIEAELERLKLAFPQIKTVLCDVESDEIKSQNKALTTWMWQFRDAIEYAEDVLDEMAYYELEDKIQSENQKVGTFASSLKRKFDMFVNRIFKADNHGIARKLAMAVHGLDNAASSVHNFLDLEKGLSRFRGKKIGDKNIVNDRETGSMITENLVFGREKEKDSIVAWLTIVDPSIGVATLSSFSIYGIGGLGKTTLAHLICKDERVITFFDQIIWVCVSDQFDAVTIITKILEVITKESPKIRFLAPLQDVLKEKLEQLTSMKFLLVLDDVWNDENRSQWENLVAPLKFGQGKILVTTRMESVANMVAKVIEGKSDRLKLDGLAEKEFLMLFNMHAFHGADPNEFRNLHPIGKQIAKKLGGCPLAAKIMGGVLNYSIDFEYWNKVLKEDVPDFQEGKDGIIGVLRLSYYHLPTCLQLCFRYCSIFPKDYEFKKDGLIKMWIGSGLIEGQMPEDVGRAYFDQLVRKSFFDMKLQYVTIMGGLKCIKFYSMHDLLHDLAQSVSEGECSRIDGRSSDISGTIRHLSFNMKSLVDIRDISHLKCLRTLSLKIEGDDPSSEDIQIFGEVLKMLKSLRLLRILKFSTSTFKLPDAIGELIHLRYLSHKSKTLHWFPTSVYKLYHLEIIKFKTGGSFEGYDANGIVNLIKLRYLDVMPQFLRQIANIGKLTFLQELESFSIRPESGHTIMELRDLKSLRKVAIANLDMVSNPEEAKEAKLNEKENLSILSLCWSENILIDNNTQPNCGSPTANAQLFDNLQPHKNLQELSIIGYRGMRSPIWMTHSCLENLISLTLCNCFLLASLPALGNLPSLKKLTLFSLPEVKKIEQTLYGNGIECVFPVLTELTLGDMNELVDWDELQGVNLFPRLEVLGVDDCPKLRRLPSIPSNLKKLDIYEVGIKHLPRIYPSFSNITSSSHSYLRVRNCPNLTTLDGCLLQDKDVMQALNELSIVNCKELMHLSSRGFVYFTSLKEITIDKCPILKVASDTQQNLLPASLQKLNVGQCGIDVPLLGSVQNCTALTLLNLDGCPHISSLPPFEILTKMIALGYLSISNCPELSSLGGLEALTSLRFLRINNCRKLLTTSSSSRPPLSANANLLLLDKLDIDRASLLQLEPLRTLSLTKKLLMRYDDSGMTCMPEEWLLQNRSTLRWITVEGATSLELLPSCMDKLLLTHLKIYDALLIQSLPDLPPSLNYLCIRGCDPVLKERYKKDNGSEWNKIAFIPKVELL